MIDPAFAPATGTPEAGGWSVREMKRILRGLTGLNFVYVASCESADNVNLPCMQGRGSG